MPPTPPTAEQLAKAKPYEANFRAFGRGLAIAAGGDALKQDGVEVYASPHWSVFNAFFPPKWSVAATPGKLDTALKLAQQIGRGFSCIVGPTAHPAVHDALKARGGRCGYWVPFMHRDLTQPIPRGKKIPGINITIHNDFSLFHKKKFAHPYIGPMTTKARTSERDYQQGLCAKGKAVNLVAWDGDTPVGVTLVYAHRKSGGIYDVGVLKSHRGRGIGGNLMLAALRAARDMGLDCAVLSAASKAVPVYQRVGFTDAGHYGSYYLGRDRLAKLKL